MDEAGIKESRVVCRNSQGLEISGSVVHLGRGEVVFEVYSPVAMIQTSEVFREFKVHLGQQIAYSGRAVVKSLVDTELKVVCSAALDGDWQQPRFSSAELQPDRVQDLFRQHLQEWEKLYLIRSEYKLQITDMENFFAELRVWLDQVELSIRAMPSKGRQLEDEVARKLATSVLPSVDALFQKFERIAEMVEPAARPVHRAYMQRRLHPLLLCAPFPHRTFTKPLGYAGDYEMVNMIARNSPEGGSLYAKIVNLCFLCQPPAVAHRNRLKELTKRLVEETVRVVNLGRTARIFSLACGPAIEVQDFLREYEISNKTELTLLDFNEETIEHVTVAFTELKAKLSRRMSIQFVKRSIHHLLKESLRSPARPDKQGYDFVYCAGMFDYLPNAVCQRLMTLLHDWVAPGGLLLATNVAPFNPVRTGTEHLLDWHLICRKVPQLHALRPTQVPLEDFVVRSDMTGVNLFMEVRKPKHG